MKVAGCEDAEVTMMSVVLGYQMGARAHREGLIQQVPQSGALWEKEGIQIQSFEGN